MSEMDEQNVPNEPSEYEQPINAQHSEDGEMLMGHERHHWEMIEFHRQQQEKAEQEWDRELSLKENSELIELYTQAIDKAILRELGEENRVYWEDDQWRSRYTPLFSYDRTKILHHITDQDFLKRVVHRFRGADSRSDNEGSDALRNITDQQYLIELAQNESVNCFLREAALQGVNDITVLQNFANPVIQPSGYYTTAENGTPIFHLTKSSKDQERDRKLYNLSLAAQKRLEKLST